MEKIDKKLNKNDKKADEQFINSVIDELQLDGCNTNRPSQAGQADNQAAQSGNNRSTGDQSGQAGSQAGNSQPGQAVCQAGRQSIDSGQSGGNDRPGQVVGLDDNGRPCQVDDQEADVSQDTEQASSVTDAASAIPPGLEELCRQLKDEASDFSRLHGIRVDIPYLREHKAELRNVLIGMAMCPAVDKGILIDTSAFVAAAAMAKGYDVLNASADTGLLHQLPEQLVICQRAEDIFGRQFININSPNFSFSEIIVNICKMIEDNGDIPSKFGELSMVRSFMTKIIIFLNTNFESSLRVDGGNNVGADVYALLKDDIKQFVIADKVMNVSWMSFVNGLLSKENKACVYRFKSYEELNRHMSESLKEGGVLEHLLGTMLKSFIPSIIIDHFYAIRTIYIIARLLTIYQHEKIFSGKSVEEIAKELKTIAALGLMTYENIFNSTRMMTRTVPRIHGKKEMTPEFSNYIMCHMIVGGQFFLLRAIERALPVLAIELADM